VTPHEPLIVKLTKNCHQTMEAHRRQTPAVPLRRRIHDKYAQTLAIMRTSAIHVRSKEQVSSLSVTRQRLVQHTAVRMAKRNAVTVCTRNERGGGDSGFRFFRIEIKHAEARNGRLRRWKWQRICLRAVGSCDSVFEQVYSGRHDN
jgi:hypothetical protein